MDKEQEARQKFAALEDRLAQLKKQVEEHEKKIQALIDEKRRGNGS